MKVFVSWSSEPARSIARVLYNWLPTVVQHVDPWMSDEEIESGGRWNDEIAASLDQADFGIVCVTAANQHRPWLMFEAGALAKRLNVARVVPLCVDMSPAEVTGPLSAFQSRVLDKDGIRKLVQELASKGDRPLTPDRLDQLFTAMWPEFERQIDEAKRAAPDEHQPRRSAQDMLEELVERVRRIERQSETPRRWLLDEESELLVGGGEPLTARRLTEILKRPLGVYLTAHGVPPADRPELPKPGDTPDEPPSD
ncbi:toll/interleukin-1 receptor domain-containing protein [Micromonospora sp. HUAS YX12]|uniref:Toll/interleukin-1 receptor domain-containing protein n=1 Tax=Micromonospora sp. HUAS YX12 TaxID=3156396 RepID=A0AAU7R4A1_9ACTN